MHSSTLGCVLPDHNDIEVELRDGESIAVDWHFVVFEDLLDTSAICNLRSHSTSVHSGGSGGNGSSGVQPASPSSPVSPVSQHGRADNYIHTPLQRCLDKFTEQEKLEGVVCPRCRASDGEIDGMRCLVLLVVWLFVCKVCMCLFGYLVAG